MTDSNRRTARRIGTFVVLAVSIAALVWHQRSAPAVLRTPDRLGVVAPTVQAEIVDASERSNRSLANEERDVAVRVRTSTSGDPIANASVRVIDTGERALAAVVTGSDGACSLRAQVGERTFVARAAGHREARTTVLVDDATTEIALALDPTGRLTVRVLHPDDRPAIGVLVEVYPFVSSEHGRKVARAPASWPTFVRTNARDEDALVRPRCITGDDGSVTFEHMPCDLPLLARATSGVPTIEGTVTIPVTPGHERLTLVASSSACVIGRLEWEGGGAALEASLLSLESHSKTFPGRLGPRVDGSFEWCGIPMGTFHWRVDVVGEPQRVTEIAQAVVDVGTIRIPRLHRVRGYVRSTTTNPALFGVVLSNESNERTEATPTDWSRPPPSEPGLFVLEAPRGRYRLQVAGQGGVVHSQVVDVPCDRIDIDIDPHVAGIRFTDVPAGIGALLDVQLLERAPLEAGSIARGRSQFLSGVSNPSRVVRAETNVDVMGISPGIYGVALRTPSASSDRWWESVTLSAGGITELSYSDIVTGGIRGSARSEDGEHVAACAFRAELAAVVGSRAKSEPRAFTTDADGGFVLDGLSPGRWIVYARDLAPPDGREVVVEPGRHTDVVLIVPRAGSVTGAITLGGEPCAGLYVSIIPLRALRIGKDGPGHVAVGDDGRFEFTSVVAGSYTLTITGEARGKSIDRAMRVEVAPRTRTRVDVELDQPLVTYRLVDEDGPITDVTGGTVLLSKGWMPLTVVDALRGVVQSETRDGPWVLRLRPRSWRIDPQQPQPLGYRLVHVPHPPQIDGETIDATGVTLTIEGSKSVPLPHAILVSVGAWRAADTLDTATRFHAEEDVDGKRVFRHVPRGARVRLVAAGWRSQYDGPEHVVDVHSDTTLTWPPRSGR